MYMPMKPSSVNQHVAGDDVRGSAHGGAHQAVDQPGLAAEFGGHPAGGIGDVRQRNGKHQDPKHPARVVEFVARREETLRPAMMAMKMVPSPTMMW